MVTAVGWVAYVAHLVTMLIAGGGMTHSPVHSTVLAALVAATMVVVVAWDHERIRALIRQEWSLEHQAHPVEPEPSPAYMHDAADLFELGREAERRQGRSE